MKKVFIFVLFLGIMFNCGTDTELNDLELNKSQINLFCEEDLYPEFFSLITHPWDYSYLKASPYNNTYKIRFDNPSPSWCINQYYGFKFLIGVRADYQGPFPTWVKINGVTKYINAYNKLVEFNYPIYESDLTYNKIWTFTMQVSIPIHDCSHLYVLVLFDEGQGSGPYEFIDDSYGGYHWVKGYLASNCD